MISLSLSTLTRLLQLEESANTATFQGISIDSRTLQAGNLFAAIKGAQVDGHDFLQDAYQKGALAALTERPIESPLTQFIVDDVVKALGILTAAWRATLPIPTVAVTGSNGKTTVKNMIATILQAACQDASRVLATQGNLNNHLGVPLTLALLNDQQRFAVVEMGMNHFNEIAYLTRLVKPTVAVITNAANAHLAGLATVAGVAQAKGEIFLGLPANGIAVLNKDDAFYPYWQQLVHGRTQLSFGMRADADVTATRDEQNADDKHQAIILHTPLGQLPVLLPIPGAHNIMNALAATAAALALGVSLDAISIGLSRTIPALGRMNYHTLSNGSLLIDDTYNANPLSTQAAIDVLAKRKGQKILVLGDMKDLGPSAHDLHFAAGVAAKKAGIDYLFTLGELAAATAEGFKTGAFAFSDTQTLITALKSYIDAHTTLLIKGSRSMRMERIVQALSTEPLRI